MLYKLDLYFIICCRRNIQMSIYVKVGENIVFVEKGWQCILGWDYRRLLVWLWESYKCLELSIKKIELNYLFSVYVFSLYFENIFGKLGV